MSTTASIPLEREELCLDALDRLVISGPLCLFHLPLEPLTDAAIMPGFDPRQAIGEGTLDCFLAVVFSEIRRQELRQDPLHLRLFQGE